jgi:uncharacterized membrane protein
VTSQSIPATAPHHRSLGRFAPSHHVPRNVYQEVHRGLEAQDRIALVVTGAVGTMWAVYAFATFMIGWMLFQVAAGKQAFDPYPFAFLLFLGNIIQLLLMPLIMVGQNLQNRHAEARAEEEYETVGKIFHDIEETMRHLDAQDGELLGQTHLLLALVEATVPSERRAAIIAAAGLADEPAGRGPGVPGSGTPAPGQATGQVAGTSPA